MSEVEFDIRNRSSQEYLEGRLQREYPEIYEQWKRGNYENVVEAAVSADWIDEEMFAKAGVEFLEAVSNRKITVVR